MYCTKCGRKIEEQSQYCPYCGHRISNGSNMSQPIPKSAKKEKLFNGKFILAMLGGLAISSLIFLVWYGNMNTNSSFLSEDEVYNRSVGMLLGIILFAVLNAIFEWKKGRIIISEKLALIRETVGVSLGCMISNMEILSTIGPAYDVDKAIRILMIEAISVIVIYGILMFIQRKQNNRKEDSVPLALIWLIACIYNVVFYYGGFILSNNLISATIVVILPLIGAIGGTICFFYHKRR